MGLPHHWIYVAHMKNHWHYFSETKFGQVKDQTRMSKDSSEILQISINNPSSLKMSYQVVKGAIRSQCYPLSLWEPAGELWIEFPKKMLRCKNARKLDIMGETSSKKHISAWGSMWWAEDCWNHKSDASFIQRNVKLLPLLNLESHPETTYRTTKKKGWNWTMESH